MKKIILSTATLFILAGSAFAQEWNMDKANSQLLFSIAHMGISQIGGAFGSVTAKFTSSKDDFSDAVIELTADVNSINTGNEQRNNHLKTADFFNAAQFGTLTFKSTSFKKTGDKTYQLVGDLTLHGVTKPVTLHATLTGPITSPMNKKSTAGFKVTGIIRRSDFGVGATGPNTGLGDEVSLLAYTEFIKG